MEIGITLNNQLVYDRNFGTIKDYALRLRSTAPNIEKMKDMEGKFLELVKKDNMVANCYKIATVLPIAVLTTTTNMVYADTLGGVTEKIRTITAPIIELLAGLGYPITYGMLITGAIMVIMGKKSKGIEIIKWACIGYIGLQFVPFLLGLLEQIGRELRNSL